MPVCILFLLILFPSFSLAGDSSEYDEWMFDETKSESSADFRLYSVWKPVSYFDKIVHSFGLSSHINDISAYIRFICSKKENNYFELSFQQRTIFPEGSDLGDKSAKELTDSGFEVVNPDQQFNLSFINDRNEVIFEIETKSSISLSNIDMMVVLELFISISDLYAMQLFSEKFVIRVSALNNSNEFYFAPKNYESAGKYFVSRCVLEQDIRK
jgi:hypothetical protein